MKGLALAKEYYQTYMDSLLDSVPQARGRFAAGLVGEGSQCFGFDDQISQDHDFCPGFCIWLNDEDFVTFGADLQKAYDQLPKSFHGLDDSNTIALDRLGVMSITQFYGRFTGSDKGVPETPMNWLCTPEYQLAAATNGQIFSDATGEFTSIREALLNFYPEDVRRKKIAARAAVMSQAGQYNLLRMIQRGDTVASMFALTRFTEAAISMVYLLKKRYMPFYKWAFHGLRTGSKDGFTQSICDQIQQLSHVISLIQDQKLDQAHQLAFRLTEAICQSVATELHQQQLSQTASPFLQDHLNEIMVGIQDPQIRKLPPMFDFQN